jgi:preprotein translocase subunit SecA
MIESHPEPVPIGAELELAGVEPVRAAPLAPRPSLQPMRAVVADPNDPATWAATPRNAPCPCGSGKKYKHCHGRLA